MERNVTIISTKGQTKKTILSSAVTLADLKFDMTNAGIDYAGMSFYEGVSKTTFLNDDTILPTNLPYKGNITNDLLIMLTVKDKKISSGASRSRSEIYAAIKVAIANDPAAKDKFNEDGNYTRKSSDELEAILNSLKKAPKASKTAPTAKDAPSPAPTPAPSKTATAPQAEQVKECKTEPCCTCDCPCVAQVAVLKSVVGNLIGILGPDEQDIISDSEVSNLMEELHGPETATVASTTSAKEEELKSIFDDSEIAAMKSSCGVK